MGEDSPEELSSTTLNTKSFSKAEDLKMELLYQMITNQIIDVDQVKEKFFSDKLKQWIQTNRGSIAGKKLGIVEKFLSYDEFQKSLNS